jgi:DNA processing protein
LRRSHPADARSARRFRFASANPHMHDASVRDLLIALSLLPFLTPNRTRLLLDHFDPISSVLDTDSRLLEGILSVTPEQAAQVRNPLTKESAVQVAALRNATVTLADDTYPDLLRHIADPPLALFYRGDLSLFNRPGLAIVGSRRASTYAINVAELLARQLAPTGLTIISGLALGIDGAAHTAALDAGGTTIAVLGTGLDVIYPRANRRLTARIAQHGLIVTEFPPYTPPRPENFPIRNRIISGLSYGAVIVEATARSGSLITARMAAEQGREVFAVPGSIFSPGSEGTHRLVQYGAKLVHDADDVLHELPRHVLAMLCATTAEEAPPPDSLLAALSRDEGVHVDTLAAKLGRTPAAVAQSLLQLELDGWIRAMPGARYVRVK